MKIAFPCWFLVSRMHPPHSAAGGVKAGSSGVKRNVYPSLFYFCGLLLLKEKSTEAADPK